VELRRRLPVDTPEPPPIVALVLVRPVGRSAQKWAKGGDGQGSHRYLSAAGSARARGDRRGDRQREDPADPIAAEWSRRLKEELSRRRFLSLKASVVTNVPSLPAGVQRAEFTTEPVVIVSLLDLWNQFLDMEHLITQATGLEWCANPRFIRLLHQVGENAEAHRDYLNGLDWLPRWCCSILACDAGCAGR
jgi:hypothetical protein